MANAISQVSNEFSAPYLTLAEFKSAPTGIDFDDLVIGGNANAQDAELLNAIIRASSWIDQFCNQQLAASTTTDLQKIRMGRGGIIQFAPDNSPVIALTALAYGSNPNNLVSVDASLAWIDSYTISYPLGGGYIGSATSFSSGSAAAGQFIYIKYSYVNGFPNTVINAQANIGDVSVTVKSGTGITAGSSINIYDGMKSEWVTVASTYVFGSTIVPLTSALLFEHDAGIAFSAFPAAIKQAAILMTSVFLQVRGDASLTMAVSTNGQMGSSSQNNIQSNIDLAKSLLNSYRRMR